MTDLELKNVLQILGKETRENFLFLKEHMPRNVGPQTAMKVARSIPPSDLSLKAFVSKITTLADEYKKKQEKLGKIRMDAARIGYKRGLEYAKTLRGK